MQYITTPIVLSNGRQSILVQVHHLPKSSKIRVFVCEMDKSISILQNFEDKSCGWKRQVCITVHSLCLKPNTFWWWNINHLTTLWHVKLGHMFKTRIFKPWLSICLLILHLLALWTLRSEKANKESPYKYLKSTKNPLDFMQSNVFKLMLIYSLGEAHFFMAFIDDTTRIFWGYN